MPGTLSTLILDMLEAYKYYEEACDKDDDIGAQLLYEDFLKRQEALDAWRPD